jgi:hypothetical protein
VKDVTIFCWQYIYPPHIREVASVIFAGINENPINVSESPVLTSKGMERGKSILY